MLTGKRGRHRPSPDIKSQQGKQQALTASGMLSSLFPFVGDMSDKRGLGSLLTGGDGRRGPGADVEPDADDEDQRSQSVASAAG